MTGTTSWQHPGRIDRAVRLLSLDEKARLLADRASWRAGAADRERVRSLLAGAGSGHAAEDASRDSQVSGLALRRLYAAALTRALAEAHAWVAASTAGDPPEEHRADALVAAVGRRTIERSAVDDRVRRLLLLAARGGLPHEPVATIGALATSAAPGSIAVIGEHAARTRRSGARCSSPLSDVRATLPASVATYALGALVGDGAAGIPGEQLTDPSTGEPGVRLRLLDAAGSVVGAEQHRSAHVRLAEAQGAAMLELTTLWLPVESDRIRLCAAGGGHARVTIGGHPLIDGALDGGDWLAAELTVTAGVPLEIRVERTLDGTAPVTLRLGTMPACFDPGRLIADAVLAASRSEVALVVVAPEATAAGLAPLPGCQDDLVRAVAAANPRTVVLVDGDAAVLTPWRDEVAAVLTGVDDATSVAEALRAVATQARVGAAVAS